MTRFTEPKQLLDHQGEELGTSDWILTGQRRITGFADDTEDHQRIHVDVERARTGPFGTTIAHGYLTLSLAPAMLAHAVNIGSVHATVNYGPNKMRFPAPVPAGSRVCGRVALTSAAPRDDTIEAVFGLTSEIEGGPRPACVAEVLVLYS